MPRKAHPDNAAQAERAQPEQISSGEVVVIDQARPGKLRRAGQRASRLFSRHLRPIMEEKISPALQKGARAAVLELAKPQNARALQRTLGGLASWAAKTGFQLDPDARLLFEFIDETEARHSRESVLNIVLRHAVIHEPELLQSLLKELGHSVIEPAAAEDSSHGTLGEGLLELLCELAALGSTRGVPSSRDAQLDYFQAAAIDPRFKPLGPMAAGLAGAFQNTKSTKNSREPRSAAKTSLPARFIPSLDDPAARFRTTGQLLALHTYLLRAMLEALPDTLQMIAELERQARAQSPDILDLDSP